MFFTLLALVSSSVASNTGFCGDGDAVVNTDDDVIGVLLAEDRVLDELPTVRDSDEILSEVVYAHDGAVIGYVWGPHGHDPIGYVWGPHGLQVVGYVFGPHGDEERVRRALDLNSRATR